MRKQKGITLIALVITIIVLLILAGVTVVTLTGDNGLLTKSESAKVENLKAEIREKIQTESAGLEPERQLKSKTDNEIFQLLQGRLDLQDATYDIGSKSMVITTKEGYIFTVLFDGTVKDGKFACLDIADGNIDLYSNGYNQYTGNLQGINKNNATEYIGKYIITGTTTENVVRVCDEGTFDITIKNLNIDVSNKTNLCAFNANRGSKKTGCYVTITLEGDNNLKGEDAPGLGFSQATPNVNGVTNGSTLTIEGNGKLKAETGIGSWAAGIGSGYNGWEVANGSVSNIIINSGDITAIGGGGTTHGAGIGTPLNQSVNNIIINGGTIKTRGTFYGAGIGDCNRTTENVTIKGGNVFARGSTNIKCIPTNGTNNLYETQIKLNEEVDGKKITSIITSDSISYGVNDMYTLEDGMLYLYLPLGSRTITIECNGKTYSGTVETSETASVVTLNEQ